jgi:hypothetical protein
VRESECQLESKRKRIQVGRKHVTLEPKIRQTCGLVHFDHWPPKCDRYCDRL